RRLRRHFDVASADRRIGRTDALNVGVDQFLIVRAERLGLHRSLEPVVLDLAVAVEHDLVDQLAFVDRDDQGAAGNADLDVREITCGVEPLDRFVDVGSGEADTGPDRDVRTHGLFACTIGSPHLNITNGRRFRGGSRGKYRYART